MYEDVKITDQEIADIMANDIIKREIIDSEESKKARKDIEKQLKKFERAKEKSKVQSDGCEKPEENELPETPAEVPETENQ
jgi:F0F1-type ATP synthase epsilon subunit